MNVYDAAWPKGTASRRGTHPRRREANPGTQRDALYAARYTLLDANDQPVGDAEFTEHDPDDAVALTPDEQTTVDQAIADETPPDAR